MLTVAAKTAKAKLPLFALMGREGVPRTIGCTLRQSIDAQPPRLTAQMSTVGFDVSVPFLWLRRELLD